MDDDAVLAEVWRRMGTEAARARDASSKLTAPTPPTNSSVEEAADRLKRTVAILADPVDLSSVTGLIPGPLIPCLREHDAA